MTRPQSAGPSRVGSRLLGKPTTPQELVFQRLLLSGVAFLAILAVGGGIAFAIVFAGTQIVVGILRGLHRLRRRTEGHATPGESRTYEVDLRNWDHK